MSTATELRNGFGDSSNQTVVMGTISYARPRTKFVAKLQTTPLIDSTEFIEQWNPSPPWSEAAQKVPDMGPQELSPYMTTTTPPTPNSANIITPTPMSAIHLSAGIGAVVGTGLSGPKSATNGSLSGHGSAFSFDWVPEQFVPVAATDCSSLPPPPPISCVSFLPQELSHRSFSHWPTTASPLPPLSANHIHSHHLHGGYEEIHIHHHHHRGVNASISGDILVSSGADKNNSHGRDSSSDDDRVGAGHQQQQQQHHSKGH